LGVRFPPSYRSFLTRFGAGTVNGFWIAGLFHHPDKSAWLSSMTSKTRQLTEAEWQYSAIAATAAPGDTRTMWDHVVIWNLGMRQHKWTSPAHLAWLKYHVAISHDGGDYTFYLDTGAPQLESPVVALGPGLEDVVLAPDFKAFAIARFNGTLPYFS
jgi:hypothetical protein